MSMKLGSHATLAKVFERAVVVVIVVSSCWSSQDMGRGSITGHTRSLPIEGGLLCIEKYILKVMEVQSR